MDDQPQSAFPQQTPEQPETPAHGRPRRRRRLVAGVAATALVAGLGGAGIGYAAGHGFTGRTTDVAAGTQQAGTSGGGEIQSIPGSGFGDQRGLQAPSDPFAGAPGDGSGTSQGQSTDTTTKAAGSQLTGLVRIVTTMKYAGAKAAGTGMVLTSDGRVVTNHHVVAGATSVRAEVMTTGKTYTARVVGTDAKDDVAVLQLSGASGLSSVTTATSGAGVGDAVTAVGDANGTTGYLSAASGTVTALGQTITTASEGTAAGERLTGLMKISSDVVSGDSGGATYDADGHVVGMTTAASSGTPDIVGYAVPVAKVMRIVDDLETGVANARYDYTLQAFLGVGLSPSNATVAGVYPGTPAARAGIVGGDRITKVGGAAVATTAQLRAAVARLSPGDRVAITWSSTSGAVHSATVTLATGPVQ